MRTTLITMRTIFIILILAIALVSCDQQYEDTIVVKDTTGHKDTLRCIYESHSQHVYFIDGGNLEDYTGGPIALGVVSFSVIKSERMNLQTGYRVKDNDRN